MNRINTRILSVLLLFTCLSYSLYARSSKKPRVAPKAILIQINTERARTQYLRKKGDTHKLEELHKAADNATTAMINDFRDHFNFCPVYYFYDSNLQDVINRNYSVLMDAELKHPAQLNISSTDEVKIAYYGYPETDRHLTPEGEAQEDPNSPEARRYNKVYGPADYKSKSKALESGLVVRDKDFRENRMDDRFFVGRNRNLDIFRDHNYSYSSTQFTIDYVRSAKTLNRLLTEYYGGGSAR